MTSDVFYMLIGAIAAIVGVSIGALIVFLLLRAHGRKYKEFAEFVADEIFDERADWDTEVFKEIACRKLYKLGLVDKTNTSWIHKQH